MRKRGREEMTEESRRGNNKRTRKGEGKRRIEEVEQGESGP